MLCNVLGMLCNVLSRPRHALQRPRHAFARSLADLGMLLQGPRSPTSKRKPPTCCLISCEAKGVVYHQVSYLEAWWYTTASGGVSLQCGTPRTLQKHAEVGQGRCQACLGVVKQAYTSWVPTIKGPFLLWEPKMCRLVLQLLGILGNILGRP